MTMTPAGDADVGKGARAASGGAVAIRAEDSLSALSALLGEDEVEARRRREMDEADARRAEAQAEERKDCLCYTLFTKFLYLESKSSILENS